MRAYLICDSRGKIVGTAPSGVEETRTTLPGTPVSKGEPEEETLQVEIVPEALSGQTIHEVELPPELAELEDGAEFQKALSGYRVATGEVKLVRR